MTLSERDQAVIWHPFTQHKIMATALPITSGKGAYLYDENGKRYLDLVASWWTNIHGHAQPDIAKAIYDQASTLEHVLFAGFTHEPAVELAENLLKLLPPAFSKVFYSDNGSTSIEVAIKMSYQYWRNLGQTKRRRFIAFEGAYHGDTFGAMSVSARAGYFSHFSDLLFSVDTFSYPTTYIGDKRTEEKEHEVLEQIKTHLECYADEIASLIIEPLVQGAAGMRMCTPRFLRALEKLVRSYNILIIYDEVMTGFSRTGDYFACLTAGTVPDIICMAKGMTGGFLPLSATICQARLYEAFLGDTFASALIHGHTYTANPIACAAGVASMKLLTSSATQAQVALIEQIHREELNRMVEIGAVEKPRYCGTIAAFEFKSSEGYGAKRGYEIQSSFIAQGLLMRPIGNVFYFFPPYCITEQELRGAYDVAIHEMQGEIA
jgi:adenosylmethionine-8-amino-7-oxononanoate aminotransferase